MHQTPSVDSLQLVLRSALPGVTPLSVHPLPSLTPRRIYRVVVADGSTLLLVMAPPAMSRLLRSEQLTLRSDLTVVRWLRDTLPPQDKPCSSSRLSGDEEPHAGATDSTPLQSAASHLAPFLPTVLHHSPSPSELGAPYHLLQPTEGVPISSLATPLTAKGRVDADLQSAQLWRSLSSLTSPSRRFGPAAAVLAADPDSPYFGTVSGIAKNSSAETWSEAFHTMLESILRDGEDMAVMLAYAAVRSQFRRLRHVLDCVTRPRLTFLDGSEDCNVLVTVEPALSGPGLSEPVKLSATEAKQEKDEKDAGSRPGPGPGPDQPKKPPRRHDRDEARVSPDGASEKSRQAGTGRRQTEPKEVTVRVTGLRDWGNCVFGDPLLSLSFSTVSLNPASGLEGAERAAERLGLDLGGEDDFVQDKDRAGVRLLFYQVYHAICCIVKEYYRPRKESRDSENHARKCLNEALVKLSKIDDDRKRRHPRPSTELSPAKRHE